MESQVEYKTQSVPNRKMTQDSKLPCNGITVRPGVGVHSLQAPHNLALTAQSHSHQEITATRRGYF